MADPIGDEIRRWRVQHTKKRVRILDRGGEWAVMYSDSVHGALMYAYDARWQAEDVAERIRALDGDDWHEVPLPAAHWWA